VIIISIGKFLNFHYKFIGQIKSKISQFLLMDYQKLLYILKNWRRVDTLRPKIFFWIKFFMILKINLLLIWKIVIIKNLKKLVSSRLIRYTKLKSKSGTLIIEIIKLNCLLQFQKVILFYWENDKKLGYKYRIIQI